MEIFGHILDPGPEILCREKGAIELRLGKRRKNDEKLRKKLLFGEVFDKKASGF